MARRLKTDLEDNLRLDAQLMSDLWVFRFAGRLGSVTAAAARLRVTQGAVSQRVMRLEGRLGIALFARKKGRLILTEAGGAILDAVNDAVTHLDGVLSKYDRAQRRSLVISCVPSLATEWLVPRLNEFYQENPNIELFIRSEMSVPTADRMEEDGIDILISYQPTPPRDLYELATLQEMVVPVCSRSYRDLLTSQKDDLEVTLLHDDAPGEYVGPSIRMLGPEWQAWNDANPAWRPRVVAERHFNLANLTYHAALSDQGLAMGRAVLINRLLNRGELVPATDLPPVPGDAYHVSARRPGDARSPLRVFANWMIRAMENSQRETLSMIGRLRT